MNLVPISSEYRPSPVEVTLPRLLGVGQARCYYTNGHFQTDVCFEMAPERGSAPRSPDPKSGVLLVRRLGNGGPPG